MYKTEDDSNSDDCNLIDFPKDDENEQKFIQAMQHEDFLFAKVVENYLRQSSDIKNEDDFTERFIRMFNKFKKLTSHKSNVPEQTVFDDYIICLEDGKKMKMLKRHLRVNHNMTFSEYKQKWGLPIDYPCTCKNYSKVRADIASKKSKK